MNEIENAPITITSDDITNANQLSLGCPICGNPVERYVTDPNLVPVECADCGTLYHRLCWEQGASKCAMIGCTSKRYKLYAEEMSTVLTISANDLGRERITPDKTTKKLKEQERQVRDELYGRSIFRIFFDWLLRQIKILD